MSGAEEAGEPLQREREPKGRACGNGLRAPLESGDPEPAALPPGGRRVTAWLKDGELGKRSFRRSQRLAGLKGLSGLAGG